jgi:hypothetical protein
MSALGALPASMYVGSNGVPVEHLNGLIDDLVILPRALSATEVKALYDCGMPASPGAVSSEDVNWVGGLNVGTATGAATGQIKASLNVLAPMFGSYTGVIYIANGATATVMADLYTGVYLVACQNGNSWGWSINWVQVAGGNGYIKTTETSGSAAFVFSGDDLQITNNTGYDQNFYWTITRLTPVA